MFGPISDTGKLVRFSNLLERKGDYLRFRASEPPPSGLFGGTTVAFLRKAHLRSVSQRTKRPGQKSNGKSRRIRSLATIPVNSWLSALSGKDARRT